MEYLLGIVGKFLEGTLIVTRWLRRTSATGVSLRLGALGHLSALQDGMYSPSHLTGLVDDLGASLFRHFAFKGLFRAFVGNPTQLADYRPNLGLVAAPWTLMDKQEDQKDIPPGPLRSHLAGAGLRLSKLDSRRHDTFSLTVRKIDLAAALDVPVVKVS